MMASFVHHLIFIKLFCLPSAEVGNCSIRKDPPTALGYRDPSASYPSSGYSLYSCTTNDNSVYEVHVIGIYGDSVHNTYEVSVLPRGAVTKPIVLILTSVRTTHWKVHTAVDTLEVVYGVS